MDIEWYTNYILREKISKLIVKLHSAWAGSEYYCERLMEIAFSMKSTEEVYLSLLTFVERAEDLENIFKKLYN